MRNADGPISVPRRLPPRSRGTPMMWTAFMLASVYGLRASGASGYPDSRRNGWKQAENCENAQKHPTILAAGTQLECYSVAARYNLEEECRSLRGRFVSNSST